MKKFKQLASLSLAFAMVVGSLSITAPTTAYAADETELTPCGVTTSALKVEYPTEEITVEKDANDTIYYTTKWSATNPSKAVWSEAIATTTTQAAIDFSFTSPKADQTFYITDDVEKKPAEIVVKKQETGLIVAFSGTATPEKVSKYAVENADFTTLNNLTYGYQKGTANSNKWAYAYLTAVVKNGTTITALSATEAQSYLQFKKGTTGKWQDIANLDVRKYASYGATLYFRIKATNDAAVSTSSALQNLGRTSKEITVKYAKQAAAPTVTINGATKKIGLNVKEEYRVFTTSGSTITYGDWIAVKGTHTDEKGKMKVTYLSDLYEASGSAWDYKEYVEGQGVQVRIAGTNTTVASKIRTVKINAVETPAVSTSAGISFSSVKTTSLASGIKVSNNCTSCAFQVAVVSGSAADLDVNDTTKVKWITVGAKTSTTAKTVIIKKAALDKGNNIIFRTATVKANAKTGAQFLVSSAPVDFDFNNDITLLTQTFAISDPEIKNPATGVSGSAVVTTSGDAIKVTVANPATVGAFTVELAVTTTNVANSSTPTIKCVESASDSAGAGTVGKVKLAASGKISDNKGTFKITVASDAKDAETKVWRVTIDGMVKYITIEYTRS